MHSEANRRTMLKLLMVAGVAGTTGVGGVGEAAAMDAISTLGGLHSGAEDRVFWVENLRRVSEPLLMAMKDRRLKELMPVECQEGVTLESRQACTYLEAVGRLLSGIAPWLEYGPREGREGELRGRFAEYARAGIASGCDSASPDYLNFGNSHQTLVDAAFLGLGIMRAPTELWEKLSAEVKQNVVKCMKAVRPLKPGNNNWVLFSAMVETSLRFMGEEWEKERVTSAIDKLDSWYKGDGVYGDGPEFHWDYYNSIVMQPFLLQIFDREAAGDPAWKALQPTIEKRALRYAAILELMISPEGTYPAIGRSLAYRCGAFQLLAEMGRREHLPEGVSPAQVRSALTAVMRRQLGAPGTFDKNGWLTIGFCGHQPGVGDAYISTGSLYLCSEIFLPLGLSASRAFWSGPGADWSSRKQWSGVNFVSEHWLESK